MRNIVLAMLGAGCLIVNDAAAQVRDGQAALARDLTSGDRNRVAAALERLPLIPSPEPEPGSDRVFREGYAVTTELVEALIVALDREMRLLGDASTEPDTHLEMKFGLVDAVAATRHPLTVDILLRAWGVDVLLLFGPDVVLPRAVELAGSPEATAKEARGALHVLEIAIQRWGEELGPEIREAMKEVAILHLEGPPESFASATAPSNAKSRQTLSTALAKVLRDPELTAIARKARHPSNGRPGIPL